jgi:predicted dehydrogenase
MSLVRAKGRHGTNGRAPPKLTHRENPLLASIRCDASVTVSATVVGAGLMGRWHATELERAGGAVVAVVDPDASAAGRLAARHSSARAFSGLGEALAAVRADAVHVCTPTASHVELVEESLAGGADVLVEKPLAPDAPATEALITRAREAGRLLCPVHQYLFQPGFQVAERAGPSLAPWRHLDATTCSAGAAGRPASELDTIAADILPHLLASLERLLPAGLSGVGWSAARLAAGELRAAGVAGNATIGLCVSMGGRPTRNELRLIGSGGTVELDFFHGYGFVERGDPSRATKAVRPFSLSALRSGAAAANLTRRALRREPAYPGLRELIQRFYAASLGRTEAPISLAESLAVARARDAVLGLARSETASRQDERHGAQQHLGIEP